MKLPFRFFAAFALSAALCSCDKSNDELPVLDNPADIGGNVDLGGTPKKLLVYSVHYWNVDGRDNIKDKKDFDVKSYEYDKNGVLSSYKYMEVLSDKTGKQYVTARISTEYTRPSATQLKLVSEVKTSSYCSFVSRSETATPDGGTVSVPDKELYELDVNNDNSFSNQWVTSEEVDMYRLNDKGYICEDESSFAYNYDENGHFIAQAPVQYYCWEGGNRTAILDERGNRNATITYTEQLNKACGIDLPYFMFTSEDDGATAPLSSTGAYGTPCKNLPSKLLSVNNPSSGLGSEWVWTLDSEGYPVSVHLKGAHFDTDNNGNEYLRNIEEVIEFHYLSFEDYQNGKVLTMPSVEDLPSR